MATLTVKIDPKNSAQIMQAISLIKGVKKVRANEDDIYTHEDREAYVRALNDFNTSDSVAELKEKYRVH